MPRSPERSKRPLKVKIDLVASRETLARFVKNLGDSEAVEDNEFVRNFLAPVEPMDNFMMDLFEPRASRRRRGFPEATSELKLAVLGSNARVRASVLLRSLLPEKVKEQLLVAKKGAYKKEVAFLEELARRSEGILVEADIKKFSREKGYRITNLRILEERVSTKAA